MKNKKAIPQQRSWMLIVVSLILIQFGLALVVLAVANISNFGWWSLFIGLSGATTIGAAVTSIVRNDPSWILLDLILPG